MKEGFRLTKCLSNDRDVLVEISECERASSVVNLDIEDLPTVCALGLKWNVEAVKFVWDASAKVQTLVEEKPMTRPGILIIVSSVFDPLGFIAPYVLKPTASPPTHQQETWQTFGALISSCKDKSDYGDSQ